MNTVKTEGESEGGEGIGWIHVLSLKKIPTQGTAGKTEHISFFWGKSGVTESGVVGFQTRNAKFSGAICSAIPGNLMSTDSEFGWARGVKKKIIPNAVWCRRYSRNPSRNTSQLKGNCWGEGGLGYSQ